MNDQKPTFTPHHAVKFYGDENSLFTTVATFLGQGFIDGHPAIVIATPEHTAPILEHLKRRLIDVDQALKEGDLILLDARETLSLFMEDGMPNQHKFEDTVGATIANLAENRTSPLVRAYGEMVAVLWKEGLTEAAIRLEMYWNTLAHKRGLALLCGYAMGPFYKQTQNFDQVCREHTHVHHADPPETSKGLLQ